MTEAEWYSCANPHEMLAFIKDQKLGRCASILRRLGLTKMNSSARKLRLFACACCREIWPLLFVGPGPLDLSLNPPAAG